MQAQVVLVNFKNVPRTVACLRALEKSSCRPRRVYVVDNASTEESQAEFGKETFSLDVEWIWNAENLGFAAGCNQGIRRAREVCSEDYVWLLNNDTEPEVDALEKLLECAEETGAGVTGSAIFGSDGSFSGGVGRVHPKMASVSRVPLSKDVAGGCSKDCSLDCSTQNGSSNCRSQSCSSGELAEFDYVEGSSFFISPKCLDVVGLLSEDFFLYFEESDYCYKAKTAGFSLAWATGSIVRHYIGSSTGSENKKGGVPFFIDCLMIRNRIRFARGNGFPFVGVYVGLMISLLLRVKRLQFNRVWTILKILSSDKAFREFVEKNGGCLK